MSWAWNGKGDKAANEVFYFVFFFFFGGRVLMSSFWKQRLRIADPTRFFKYHPHTTLRSVYYKTYIYLLKMVYMCVFLNLGLIQDISCGAPVVDLIVAKHCV